MLSVQGANNTWHFWQAKILPEPIHGNVFTIEGVEIKVGIFTPYNQWKHINDVNPPVDVSGRGWYRQ